MKQFCLAMVAISLVMACKKDGGPGKQLLLSKVYVDNLLSEEYTYSLDRKPVRFDSYSTSQGQSVFAGFRLYEYENDRMSEVSFFNKSNVLSERFELSYDGSGRLTRVDRMGNDDEIDYYSVFQYDANQHLSTLVTYSTNPVKKNGEWQFDTDAQGQLVSIIRYFQTVGGLQFNDSAHFEIADKPVPAHFDYFEQTPLMFPIDKTFLGIASSSYYYYMAGGPPTSSTNTFSEKQYNGQGYITSQTNKINGNNGLGLYSITYNLKYEYIE